MPTSKLFAHFIRGAFNEFKDRTDHFDCRGSFIVIVEKLTYADDYLNELTELRPLAMSKFTRYCLRLWSCAFLFTPAAAKIN